MTDYTLKHDQLVARIIRENHGIEITPAEVAEKRRSGLEKLRARLAANGSYELPQGDVEALRLISKAIVDELYNRGLL